MSARDGPESLIHTRTLARLPGPLPRAALRQTPDVHTAGRHRTLVMEGAPDRYRLDLTTTPSPGRGSNRAAPGLAFARVAGGPAPDHRCQSMAAGSSSG